MRAVIEVTVSHYTADRKREVRYRDARGALVVRRPGWIRTTAETPGGIAKVYDMVSDGRHFQVHFPWKNEVYEGSNELRHLSDNRAENIRPQHLLEAILLDPIGEDSQVLLDVEAYGRSGFQVLHEVARGADGNLQIRRKYWFNRSDLSLSRMMVLSEDAELVTDAWYREWLEENGLPYARFIRIERPRDGYTLGIEVIRQALNGEVHDNLFDLSLPDGVERKTIGEDPA